MHARQSSELLLELDVSTDSAHPSTPSKPSAAIVIDRIAFLPMRANVPVAIGDRD